MTDARMSFEYRGHVFSPFKSEERICWACGFVIPLWSTVDELTGYGCDYDCPEIWGHTPAAALSLPEHAEDRKDKE